MKSSVDCTLDPCLLALKPVPKARQRGTCVPSSAGSPSQKEDLEMENERLSVGEVMGKLNHCAPAGKGLRLFSESADAG